MGLSGLSYLRHQRLAVSSEGVCNFPSQQDTTKKGDLRPLLEVSGPVLVE